ncbi:MAG: nuclear transport factor 2 family protein [Vicinamibacteria bacterium]
MTANEALVRNMVECYSTMDGDGLRPFLHLEAKHTAPGSDFRTDMEGSEKILDYFKQEVFPSFHQVQFEIVNLFEDEKRSAVIVEWRSILRPKSARNYTNTGVFVVEIKNGKIYWVREYFDTEKAHQNV